MPAIEMDVISFPSGKPRIAIATGTRADWGLLLPLATELSARGAEVSVAATNMHLRADLGHTIDEIRADGFSVTEIPANGDAAATAAMALSGFASYFTSVRQDVVVILGDRFEMLGVASAAMLTGVPVIHIAGGTVSEGAFDESIRHAITKMASLHFVETEKCRRRVLQMGENPRDVLVTGALGVYNTMKVKGLDKKTLERNLGFEFNANTVLATYHPATLAPLSPLSQMEEFISALDVEMERSRSYGNPLKVLFTYPNNDSDPTPLIKKIEDFSHRWKDRVLTVPSLGRVRYVSALRFVRAVIGNSSSGIVEAPSAHIPTLDIGMRQRGREAAESVIHCQADRNSISEGLRTALSDENVAKARMVSNPYYRSDTPAMMADEILRRQWMPYPVKKFHCYPAQDKRASGN